MQKDTYKNHRLANSSLVIRGQHTEITVPYASLMAIMEDLSETIAENTQREDTAVAGWSGSKRSALRLVGQLE